MRALIVSHTGALAGSNQVVLSLLRHVPASVQVTGCVFLSDGPMAEAAAATGHPLTVLPAGRARDLWRAPGVVHGLRRLIERDRPELVFSHVSKAHVYAATAAWRSRLPVVWFQHELPGTPRGLQQLAGRLPTRAVLCNSTFVGDRHRALFPRAEVHVTPPGIPVDSAGAVREHREARQVRLAVVGRLQRWKRVELTLRAMPRVLDSLPEAHLTVMGAARRGIDEDYPGELERLAAELRLGDAVTFAGEVPDARERIGEFDILVHTSENEPFGLVLLEALARGVPVIAPPAGGSADIVHDGTEGLLVDPTRTESLAAAILELAGDPQRRTAMGSAGRRRVIEHFDEAQASRVMWRTIEEILASDAAP